MTATSTASPCQSAIYLLDGSLFAHLPDYQPPEYADARIDMIVQYHGLSELPPSAGLCRHLFSVYPARSPRGPDIVTGCG